MKKISVITINYNNAEGLARTIKSVTDQSMRDYEYIVIDGKSTDGSDSVIRENASKITAAIIESDNGIYHAMNKGVKLATGDYLLFLNSGDELRGQDALTKAAEQLDGTDLISFDLEVRDGATRFIKSYPEKPNFRYMLNDSLPHPSTLIRKMVLEAAGGYDESMKIVSDWGFFITAICKNNASYRHIAEPISIFYTGGISSQNRYAEQLAKEKRSVIQKEFAPFSDLADEIVELHKYRFIFQHSRAIQLLKKCGLIKDPFSSN